MVGSLALGSAVGSIVGPLVARGIRWLAKKTRTKRDDEIVDIIARVLEQHPEAIDEIIRRVR